MKISKKQFNLYYWIYKTTNNSFNFDTQSHAEFMKFIQENKPKAELIQRWKKYREELDTKPIRNETPLHRKYYKLKQELEDMKNPNSEMYNKIKSYREYINKNSGGNI